MTLVPVVSEAAPTTTFNVLVVDDDSCIRDNLRVYLTQYHEAPYKLDVCESYCAEDALEKLATESFDVIICDINLPDRDGFYVLKEASRLQPHIKKALITAYDLESYIDIVKEEKIYNILVKTAPFNFSELSAMVHNLLHPQEAFGLDKYVQSKTPLTEVVLRSSADIMTAQAQLTEFFTQYNLPDLDAMAIVMVETITNAVYHSAKKEDGTDRYIKGQVIEALSPHEEVVVSFGVDEDKLGVSIRDCGGTITAEDILFWIERNVSGNSLLDTHGRGLYLIYRLMDRVVINVAKGRCTEFILLHYFEEPLVSNKPIYINILD